MADINAQQEKEIGAMQSDIRHISSAVERIENMIIEHNKAHARMSDELNNRISGLEFWVTAVKWGAGVFTTFLIMLFPAVKKIVDHRPTTDQVVVMIKDEVADYSIEEKKK